jgi:peroxiredoxin
MNDKFADQAIAPEFELTDTRGRTIRLSDYRGKPVVLVLLRILDEIQ